MALWCRLRPVLRLLSSAVAVYFWLRFMAERLVSIVLERLLGSNGFGRGEDFGLTKPGTSQIPNRSSLKNEKVTEA
jgi:hypothetical protein